MVISIITINYNNLLGLQATVASVFSQQYPNIEFWVIDGGSVDGSEKFLKSLPPRKGFNFISEPDNGIYHAQNKGIDLSNGDFLLFLNSGDFLYSSNSIEEVCKEISTETQVAVGKMYFKYGKTMVLRTNPSTVDLTYLCRSTIFHQAAFIRRSLFDRYGRYNENNRYVSDWEFFCIVCGINGEKYQLLTTTVSVFDVTGVSNSKKHKVARALEREASLARIIPQPYTSVVTQYTRWFYFSKTKRFQYLESLEHFNLLKGIATVVLQPLHFVSKLFKLIAKS
jgi:glycosyltransferase involved in cell wall biosynthesis